MKVGPAVCLFLQQHFSLFNGSRNKVKACPSGTLSERLFRDVRLSDFNDPPEASLLSHSLLLPALFY